MGQVNKVNEIANGDTHIDNVLKAEGERTSVVVTLHQTQLFPYLLNSGNV